MCIDVLKFSVDDLAAMGAACGVMSIQILKEADCAKDLQNAAHLAELHLRIDSALRDAAKKEHERRKREHDSEKS